MLGLPDFNVFHQGLYHLEPASAMYPARWRPSPTVANRDLKLISGHRSAYLDIAVRQPVGVLDDVRGRFTAGHKDFVRFVG